MQQTSMMLLAAGKTGHEKAAREREYETMLYAYTCCALADFCGPCHYLAYLNLLFHHPGLCDLFHEGTHKVPAVLNKKCCPRKPTTAPTIVLGHFAVRTFGEKARGTPSTYSANIRSPPLSGTIFDRRHFQGWLPASKTIRTTIVGLRIHTRHLA